MSRNWEQVDEELYLDLWLVNGSRKGNMVNAVNFTMHCISTTSRGYFELGNVINGGEYGPLKDEWPHQKTIEDDFNDYVNYSTRPEEMYG